MCKLSRSSVDRIIRSCGAQRVSKDASKELSRYLEEIGKKISKKAIKLSYHAGRKTVNAEDIKLALEDR